MKLLRVLLMAAGAAAVLPVRWLGKSWLSETGERQAYEPGAGRRHVVIDSRVLWLDFQQVSIRGDRRVELAVGRMPR